MSDPERGFLDFPRKEPGYRPADVRLRDYRAVELRLTDHDVFEQATRCMDCGVPFCHGCGCPLANVIPEFNSLVQRRQWKAALDVLLSTNCFPEFTGRICPAPCEASCVLGIHGEPVTIRQIELAIIEKAFERGFMGPAAPAARRRERVAVVGSGPAGLAVAHVLNREGFHVVVYENGRRPGGILRYGIPEFKLEKWVVDRRLRILEAEGVVFETSVEIGRDISHRYLQNRFDALVLTGGARQPRDLAVPGRELAGIHFAMPYLVQQNRRLEGEAIPPGEEILARNADVAILGGGDTGADCLGTALRQGARHVHQMEILPRPPPTRSESTPWPLWPDMLRESSSHREGGVRRWSVTTKAFLGEGGRVKALRCAEVDWVPGEGGRPAPKEKPGSEFTVGAELVLLAMGFAGPGPNRLVDDLGLERDPRGFLKRDEAGMTSSAGTFVAGDMSQGASLVVRAIADGMRTARGVAAWLDRKEARRT